MFLLQHLSAIRPVIFPDTGCPSFKHDPVKRYELYKKQWDKFPPPGDKKRLNLRSKVREYMLRQDNTSIR